MTKESLLILLLVPILAFSQTKPTVAITDLTGSGFTKAELTSISARVLYEVGKTELFIIVERERMQEILKEQQFQLSGCTSDQCVVEIGQLIGAEQMISGSVGKIGDLFTINLKIIDVGTGKILANIIEDFQGALKDFVQVGLRNAALKLVAESEKKRLKTAEPTREIASSTAKGDVEFTLSVTNINVYIDDIFIMRTDKNLLPLTLPEGTHQIKFTKEGYADWQKSINVISNTKLTYDVKLNPGQSQTASITTGVIYVKSVPDNAEVYLDGIRVGITPFQQSQVGIGWHEIRLEKELYYPFIDKIEVKAGGLATLTANLKPRFGALQIISEPSEAVVKINGKIRGKTPLNFPQIESGTYQIELSKELYHNYAEQFLVTDGSNNQRHIRLNPAFGALSIASEPAGATVYLDGQERGTTPLNINQLPSGDYQLTVALDLHESINQTILIEDAKTTALNLKLQPAYGSLKITGQPTGAEVFINDKPIGQLPINNFRLSTGFKQIRIEAPNYHPFLTQTEIRLLQTTNLEAHLQRHSGNLIILSEPPEANITINQKPYGQTPLVLNEFPTGKWDLRAGLAGYLSQSATFELQLNETKEIKLKLLTYAGSIQQKIDGLRQQQFRNGLGLSISLIGIGAGYWLGEKYISAYNQATTTKAAHRAKTNFYICQGLEYTSAAISCGLAVKFTVNLTKINRLKAKL